MATKTYLTFQVNVMPQVIIIWILIKIIRLLLIILKMHLKSFYATGHCSHISFGTCQHLTCSKMHNSKTITPLTATNISYISKSLILKSKLIFEARSWESGSILTACNIIFMSFGKRNRDVSYHVNNILFKSHLRSRFQEWVRWNVNNNKKQWNGNIFEFRISQVNVFI